MWIQSPVIREDMEAVCATSSIPWEMLRDKRVLVTGATGLIGATVVNALLYARSKMDLNLSVVALARDAGKAKEQFGPQTAAGGLEFLEGSVEALPPVRGRIDYVIHGASATASAYFVNNPVETIRTAVAGTGNLLELAREKNVSGFVYLSSMEVYGDPPKGHKVTEAEVAGFDPTAVRSCYPIGKQLCEALCCAYTAEYQVPATVIRLTQTFGPGVRPQDGRVFAQFMHCALEGRNIVLRTKGETERCYLYTSDAAGAILTVLLRGQPGEAYTAANPATYCSILDMARIAAETLAGGRISVEIDAVDDPTKLGYAGTKYVDLDTSKLEGLGWRAVTALPDMFRRMAAVVSEAEETP